MMDAKTATIQVPINDLVEALALLQLADIEVREVTPELIGYSKPVPA